ncbi:MAG: hypothetical protein L7R82_05485 [Nitrosopumilus sp.]|uniref:Cyclase/dehydrase n=1 Tax=uncultured marine thaumarchaeote KM3_25_G08 TaxID=1456105 RepID=A0A075H1Z9_9ARCH|nr:hypothetical protein [uncultured marine thaumarchaeote KM3_25_G08]MCH1519792.1 hypothetical protein [Nitrosopumilus sp.]MCH1549479.1 hypothetical protein [Nitrosopumilus sp.]RCL30563.1 MAG: hypothetical protein DBX08_06170 [Nitrosopumilus sp.]|tara:strand:- start:348 stop:788 length:441 start_codon:yes stop_codon:yes gene_type:complete
MSKFNLIQKSNLDRDLIFKISTDVENFHKVMPEYFKSLKIISNSSSEKIVLESIAFVGRQIEIKTKHVIIQPNLHKVFILTGPAKGTSFIETYVPSSVGTDISIEVDLQLTGILKLIPFLKIFLLKKMNTVMSEFITCAESYSKSM